MYQIKITLVTCDAFKVSAAVFIQSRCAETMWINSY